MGRSIDPWVVDDVIRDASIEFDDGATPGSDDPGFGAEFDEPDLERMHERYQEMARSRTQT